MAFTKLYNKITLREEPDASPLADPSFQKGHSFIFPGDELVFCTKFNAPTDLGVSTFSGNKLYQVKVSVIAKKPNIFTYEFENEFTATREFELDSFVLPLDSINAPIVPWGSDGYAPNINFKQDRSWVLPSGNFRRQINFFTTHTPATSIWQYNFWFPIIFREEYWLFLAAADNDFYDVTKPQNGKNQKWLRYHDLSFPPFGWLIKYRVELSYTDKHHHIHTVGSEYSLSNEQTGIQDYNANPDYALKSIKTCNVGGTPSASNFIFGYQNTSCFGYFQKQTAWDPGEKASLNAIFRIRPFEAGDRLGSRVNTHEAITSDIVWTAMAEHIITNQSPGIRIRTNDGRQLVTNRSGSGGCKISFDPLDDTKITVQAEIDYNKLNTIFPGVTKFTLYCRLYNGTILTT